MKSYILWDHDGVLVETEPWYFEATRRCIRALGVELEKTQYLQDMAQGVSAWERARQRGATEDQITRHKCLRDLAYQKYLREQDIEIPGVEDVLAQLSKRHAMAIVTTAKKADFALIHEGRCILDHMAFVLANGDYARSKPAPDPYLTALERFGARPEDAVVVEDSERGLKAAVAAGIDCVVVRNDFVAGQDFGQATHLIDSIHELPDLLTQLD